MYTQSSELVAEGKVEIDFERLVEEYTQKIYRYCFSILRNAHEAEDATQDVFLKVMQYKNRKNIDNMSAWLYKIAYNHCINRINRRKIIPFVRHVEKYDQRVQQEEKDEELHYILAQLKPKERALIVLRIVEDKDFNEIASILGVSIPTARKRYERTKAKIQKLLEGDENDV